MGAHLLVPLFLVGAAPEAEFVTPADPIVVSLVPPPASPPPPVEEPDPGPAAGPPAPQPAAAPRPAPPIRVHRTPPAPAVAPLVVAEAEAPPAPFPQLNAAQLAGARTAGGGSGGGGGGDDGAGAGASCDMVRRLETALKRDPEVMAAVTGAASEGDPRGALYVWDGDWVKSPRQEGKGLAGVRQAIALEVAFAPDACRKEAMRGLVLLSLNERAKVALGSGAWRWTDLLSARR